MPGFPEEANPTDLYSKQPVLRLLHRFPKCIAMHYRSGEEVRAAEAAVASLGTRVKVMLNLHSQIQPTGGAKKLRLTLRPDQFARFISAVDQAEKSHGLVLEPALRVDNEADSQTPSLVLLVSPRHVKKSVLWDLVRYRAKLSKAKEFLDTLHDLLKNGLGN